ncbi:unnamed protein product [Pleuronectes platessa]|uniref:Uncharacterized protein n=1 Tax=Pleuronectes platessa TaxID=8262 RepID=A0A9N7YIJ6_PLEPL|nr:unnamed protein product [Pleuronectes platessa]
MSSTVATVERENSFISSKKPLAEPYSVWAAIYLDRYFAGEINVLPRILQGVGVFVSAGCGPCGDDLKVLAVGSAVAGYCKTAVLAFKAPSRELVSELHQCLAGAQVSLTLEILAPISPCFAPLSLALCPSDEPLGYMEI